MRQSWRPVTLLERVSNTFSCAYSKSSRDCFFCRTTLVAAFEVIKRKEIKKKNVNGEIVFALIKLFHHSVHPHPFLLGGGGERGWTSYQRFDRRGGCWEKKGCLFSGGGGRVQFLDKNKLKSGILNDKKSL